VSIRLDPRSSAAPFVCSKAARPELRPVAEKRRLLLNTPENVEFRRYDPGTTGIPAPPEYETRVKTGPAS
jgi:hypothetical protein